MRRIFAVAALVIVALSAWLSQNPAVAPTVRAQDSNRRLFLVKFGLDGKENIDWSGSVSGAQSSISSWQFDPAKDSMEGSAWKCTTRKQNYWDTPYEPIMGPTANLEKVTEKGLWVDTAVTGTVSISTKQGDFVFDVAQTPGSATRTFLNGRASVQAIPHSTWVTRDAPADDFPSLVETKDGVLWMAYQTWNSDQDRVFVRRMVNGEWSTPEAISAPGDIFRTAIAQDGAGRVWVVWSEQANGNFDLQARSFDGKSWSRQEKLTTAANSDIYHTMAAGKNGNLFLAWQSSRAGNFDIYMRVFNGKSWGPELQVSNDAANDWEPALAVAPNGAVTIAWDTYAKGNYDIAVRTFQNGKLGPLTTITSGGAFESRVSIRHDRQNRLWLAWDEGDWSWGKDYGNQIGDKGRGLLGRRQTRVAVLENGRLAETAASIMQAVPENLRQVFHAPNLEFDGNGNPWVLFHVRDNLPRASGRGEGYRGQWKLCATSFREGRWTPMMEFPDSYSRIDAPVATARRANGGIAMAWMTEGRVWPEGFPRNQDLRFAQAAQGPAASLPDMTPFKPSAENLSVIHKDEAADVTRLRAYRADTNGRKLRIVRGDIHRHTDLSWDGNRDGSLEDAYRYALDAVAFDYLGVCDHQAGSMIPYNWWRIQKAVDLFTIRGRFAPVYSYERSLPWPNGHRNVVFAERGRPVLAIPETEQRGVEGAPKLYAYLRKFSGVTMSHTSATGAGTDFRDSDPEVEPVVEIYQGYRSNYEASDAPRATTRNESSRFAAGLIQSAWAKGIKMGVQSSSDHVSTHISYANLYVEQVDRASIVAAMKARRTYASTDNIIVDLHMGSRFMGEAFSATTPPPLTGFVSGTAAIQQVDVIRANRIVYTAPGNGKELRITYTDREKPSGEIWYYLRVIQADGQIAWSSPIWIKYP